MYVFIDFGRIIILWNLWMLLSLNVSAMQPESMMCTVNLSPLLYCLEIILFKVDFIKISHNHLPSKPMIPKERDDEYNEYSSHSAAPNFQTSN